MLAWLVLKGLCPLSKLYAGRIHRQRIFDDMNSDIIPFWHSLVFIAVAALGLYVIRCVHKSAMSSESGLLSRAQLVVTIIAFSAIAAVIIWRFGVKVSHLF